MMAALSTESTGRVGLLRTWLAAGLVATAMGLLFSLQVYVAQRGGREGVGFWEARRLEPQLIPWYVWACLAPLVFIGVERTAARRRGIWGAALAYGTLGVVATLVHAGVTGLALGWWWSFPSVVPADPAWHVRDLLRTRAVVDLMTVTLVTSGYLAIRHHRLSQQRALAAARLEARLAEAELRALRVQLEPHFLFNTLNAVGAYVRPAPDVAEAMVARLADVLRLVLGAADRRQVPLAEEMTLARRFLEIHQVRFGDRLAVRFEVDDAAREVPTPPLVLQPVVENAVRHGVEARPGPSAITVAAAVHDGTVVVRVTDASDGPPDAADLTKAGGELGALAPSDDSWGIGLANTRARLELLFGDRYTLRLGRPAPMTTEVEIAWPVVAALEPVA